MRQNKYEYSNVIQQNFGAYGWEDVSEFAAITRIYKDGRDYFANMILKDSYNETNQMLNEFSAQELIYLADYISK